MKRLNVNVTDATFAILKRELAVEREYRGSKYSMYDWCAGKLSVNGTQPVPERVIEPQKALNPWSGMENRRIKLTSHDFDIPEERIVPPPPVPTVRQYEPQPERMMRPSQVEIDPGVKEEIQAINQEIYETKVEPLIEKVLETVKCPHWEDDDTYRCYCIFPQDHDGEHALHHRIPKDYLERFVAKELWTDYRKSADVLDRLAAEKLAEGMKEIT